MGNKSSAEYTEQAPAGANGIGDPSIDPAIVGGIIGTTGTGKTSILQRWMVRLGDPTNLHWNGPSLKTRNLTSPPDCSHVSIRLVWSEDGVRFKLTLNDTPESRFMSPGRGWWYTKELIILVYDMSASAETVKKDLNSWIEHMRERCFRCYHFVIVGNKSDAANPETRSIGEEYANTSKAVHYAVSALNDLNIQEMFIEASRECFRRKQNREPHPEFGSAALNN